MIPLIGSSIWVKPLMALALTAVIYPLLGEEFLPDFKEHDFLMHWVEKPGTSLEAMRRITIRVSKELREIPGVRNFGAHIGRAEVADEIVGPNFTELWISLDPAVDYETAVQKIQNTVDGYPGIFRDVLTYLKERIKEVLFREALCVGRVKCCDSCNEYFLKEQLNLMGDIFKCRRCK